MGKLVGNERSYIVCRLYALFVRVGNLQKIIVLFKLSMNKVGV